jgi:nitroreductase
MAKFKKMILMILRKLRLYSLKLCSQNRYLGRLYFIVEPSFDREFEYTLKGRYEALISRYANDSSNGNIRRCVHRLEKGLFHRARRPKFGNEIFDELYRELLTINDEFKIDCNEVYWAKNTLTKYRRHSNNIDKVDLALEILNTLDPESLSFSEQGHELNSNSTDFNILHSLYLKRESVRFFNDCKVPFDLIENAVTISKEAPSACNRQPFSLHLMSNKEDINFIGGLAPGTQGFLENIPILCALVGHASAFRFTRDRHLIYTDSGLFLGHLLPALTSLGLSTCVLNWVPDWENDRKAINYLGLDLSKSIVCLLAIGYKDETRSPTSIKKSNGNILRFIDDYKTEI